MVLKGTTDLNVVYRFVREFSLWIIVANIIAWPIAFYALKYE